MGGKGGDGGGITQEQIMADPQGRAQMKDNISRMRDDPAQKDQFDMLYGPNGYNRALYDQLFPPEAAPAAAPAAAAPDTPAPQAAPEAQTPADPPPTTPAAPTPSGPPISAGGAIEQPSSTGNQLGGSILSPPQYWVGGINSYNQAKGSQNVRGSGRLRTTQS